MKNTSQITWYDINDRKPESGNCILIYSKSGGVAEGEYNKHNGKFVQYRWNCINMTDVTHWAYLPEPPIININGDL